MIRTALVASLLLAAPAAAQNLQLISCDNTDKKTIKAAVSWILGNMSRIDAKMGKRGLMDWPGKSRTKFVKKLKEKKLKIRCDTEKKKCQKQSKQRYALYAEDTPVLHQKRVTLCTNYYKGDVEQTAATIAHEVAHLIRLNAHRTKCKNKCQKPRFSQSVGEAVWHAARGTNYSKSACTKACP